VREPLRVVAKNFIFGTVVQGWQSINTMKNVVDFLNYALCVTAATKTLKTITQSIGDGCSQGFTRFLGDFTGEFLGFRVFDAEWHSEALRCYRI
jgi:hypothetical protein